MVTFNYDTLLEEAILDSIVGVPLHTIPQYVATDYKIIKPHGSINWAHPIKNFESTRSNSQDLISDIISSTPALEVDGDSYEIVSEDPFQRPPEKPLFPALAIPVENKQRYECPSEHWKVLEQCIHQVSKLLIIGWRANENLFVDTLAKSIPRTAHIMIVSGTEKGFSDVITRMNARWRATGMAGNFAASKPGFSDFIFSPEWENFLRAEPR